MRVKTVHGMHKSSGWKRIIKAGGYSLKGFRAAFAHEAAFRQELLIALVLIPLAVFLDLQTLERVMLIACVCLVLIVELLNSAIEAVVDRVGTEFNELAGRAKDLGSAAVLTSLLLTVYVWVEIVLIRHV